MNKWRYSFWQLNLKKKREKNGNSSSSLLDVVNKMVLIQQCITIRQYCNIQQTISKSNIKQQIDYINFSSIVQFFDT